MKPKPVRQLPSGAKRASGMLIRPVGPMTLGSCASAVAASRKRKARYAGRQETTSGSLMVCRRATALASERRGRGGCRGAYSDHGAHTGAGGGRAGGGAGCRAAADDRGAAQIAERVSRRARQSRRGNGDGERAVGGDGGDRTGAEHRGAGNVRYVDGALEDAHIRRIDHRHHEVGAANADRRLRRLQAKRAVMRAHLAGHHAHRSLEQLEHAAVHLLLRLAEAIVGDAELGVLVENHVRAVVEADDRLRVLAGADGGSRINTQIDLGGEILRAHIALDCFENRRGACARGRPQPGQHDGDHGRQQRASSCRFHFLSRNRRGPSTATYCSRYYGKWAVCPLAIAPLERVKWAFFTPSFVICAAMPWYPEAPHAIENSDITRILIPLDLMALTILYNFQRRRAESELIENLRPIF